MLPSGFVLDRPTNNDQPTNKGSGVFGTVLTLQIVPVWLFRYFPSHDGPTHIYNCLILKDIFTSHQGIAQTYYTLNPQFPVNILAHVLLTALLFIASPLIAEKLLLTIYALTLGLS